MTGLIRELAYGIWGLVLCVAASVQVILDELADSRLY